MLRFPQDLTSPQKVVLMLHGYGASGNYMIQIAPKIHAPNTLFLAPNAPYLNETGYQWFEVDHSFNTDTVKTGLTQVRPIVLQMIDSIQRDYKIEYEDIILLGFSQGAMLTLDIITHHPELRKAIAISGAFFPFENINAKSKDILLIHGTNDETVSFQYSVDGEKQLKELGAHVTFKMIPGLDHHINQEGIDTVIEFLKG